MSKIDS